MGNVMNTRFRAFADGRTVVTNVKIGIDGIVLNLLKLNRASSLVDINGHRSSYNKLF